MDLSWIKRARCFSPFPQDNMFSHKSQFRPSVFHSFPLCQLFTINKMVLLSQISNSFFFLHEFLNVYLNMWGIQITTVTLVAFGQEKFPKKNVDEASLYVKTQLCPEFFTDTPGLLLLIWNLNEFLETYFWWDVWLYQKSRLKMTLLAPSLL